jgi:acyl transferase domain-containing protein
MKIPQTPDGFSGSEIAIIGMAGRFPGAPNIAAFWNNLRDGVESISSFTDEQLLASGVDPEALQSARYVKAGAILEGVELFDAAFFGFTPRAAAGMDPQQRLFLECVWEAIEAAGYDTERYKGPISVFAGAGMSSYLVNNLYANPEFFALAGMHQSYLTNTQDSLATLVAYKLNLKGACYTVGTFCSTSLVALHLACQSLLNFECDMAVAGGVKVAVPQHTGYWFEETGIVSPDGRCRPFDAKAQGTLFGNAVGVIVLKRLKDAIADGDSIDAVILGSATNNDGSLKVSYTAPSVAGQSEVIVEALANAGVPPETITYVEAHGTATALGDPTEVAALTRAFRSGTQKKGFCGLGSVKSNIGHVDSAAGVAGVIKTVLALKNKQIPPSLHFQEPNPNIDFASTPFYVNSTLSEWKSDGIPRRAGVSSFGIGGTNAHVILQEAPAAEPSSPSRSHQLLLLSARTKSALETATRNAIDFFKGHAGLNLADTAYTLQTGRRAFNYRRFIVCRDVDDTVSVLGGADSNRMATAHQDKRNPPVAFMFPGGGAQYVQMGAELYATEPIFREEVDRCCDILQSRLSLDIRQMIYPDVAAAEETIQKLNQTSIALPALFAMEYALAKLWMTWGIHPTAMIGHSSGEYVAACLAGVFSLEDALVLVARRGQLMQSRQGGNMLAVQLPENEIRSLIDSELSLAAINGPSSCTVSGAEKAVEDFKAQLTKRNVDCRLLHISIASHSSMMDPILDAFASEVKKTRRNRPQIPFLSNVTGTWITPEEAMAPDYWVRHLRHTVRFSDGVRELLKEPNRVFLEVGPGNTLSSLVKRHLSESGNQAVLSSIRHPNEQESDVGFILNTLGRLWLTGVEVDWSGFYKKEKRHRVRLPAYPFERRRYWVEPVEAPRGYFAIRMGLSRKQENLPRPAGPEILEEELALPDSELQSEYVAPQTDLEKMLATVWRQILGFERIGIDDNFFRLGGDSLLAMQVISRVCVMFRMELPPKCLFEAPTINKLALYMIAHEARPGLVEKTARILMHIDGMTEEAVSQELSAKNKVGIKGS